MDFTTKSFKGLVSDVGTAGSRIFTRAKQYAEEAIGKSEKTEFDGQFESLADRSDRTKNWTEKIVAKTEAVLQPNPSLRYGDMIYEKLDPEGKKERMRNLEWLGGDLIDAGIDFGPGTVYGSGLIKVGKAQQNLGQTEREFAAQAYRNFVQPLKKFLDEDMKTITRERKILENKRLDLDAAKSRLRKVKTLEAQANAEEEVENAREEFDRQVAITQLLLEGISSAHTNHVRYLHDFVEAQVAFYSQCHQHMCELQKELANASLGSSLSFRPTNDVASAPEENKTVLAPGKRRAKVLYDYDAHDSKELSLMANEVIVVSHSPDLDVDWMIGERGNQKGKVPVAYLEILN